MTDARSSEQTGLLTEPLRAKPRLLTNRALIIWLVGFSALAGVAVWGYARYRRTEAEAVAVPLHRVERANVELTVTASGTLALGGQQTLKSPQNEATVEQVLVQTRNLVEAGQPLLVLRDRSTEQELRSRQV
ncbi:MAG: hypothetical protein AAGA83_24250, partial [Cyanobacteria bacterium P01_F01_bin.116]